MARCPFCKDPFTTRSIDRHTNYCKKNPDAKKRKPKKLTIDKTLYDFALDFLKENKYINSRNLAKDYHNISYRELSRVEACEFRNIISALIKEKIRQPPAKMFIKITVIFIYITSHFHLYHLHDH